MNPTIFAIESSCDDTSASLIRGGTIVSNVVASQEIHEGYGGVVPELASRAHQKNIMYVVDRVLSSWGGNKKTLDAVACTLGPGLKGSLMVGVSFVKAMAVALNIPFIGINHMHAHVLSNFIDDPKPIFPFLCLTVSGGHTQIVLVKDYLDLSVLGETHDDAVGEAFDKAAKIMGFPYPGGPWIDKLAQQGNPDAFTFSETTMPSYHFSFSGIKTAFLYFIRENKSKDIHFVEKRKNDICASFQKCLVEMLLRQLEKASADTGINTIAIAGGVSTNSCLRKKLRERSVHLGWEVHIPDMEYCTDNAAMIAMTAHHKFIRGLYSSLEVSPLARMPVQVQ